MGIGLDLQIVLKPKLRWRLERRKNVEIELRTEYKENPNVGSVLSGLIGEILASNTRNLSVLGLVLPIILMLGGTSATLVLVLEL